MFHEHREEISQLKAKNAHFEKIFDEHNSLDEKITNAEKGTVYATDLEIEQMKKLKLKLKDEVYAMIMEYKKNTQ